MRSHPIHEPVLRILFLIAIPLVLGWLTGCGLNPSEPPTSDLSTPTPVPTNTEIPRPDLAIQSIDVDIAPGEICENWDRRMGVMVEIVNQGDATSGPFAVSVNQLTRYVIGSVGIDETVAVRFPLIDDQVFVQVDTSDQVFEEDEGNNQLEQVLVRPTIPPQCILIPTPEVVDLEPLVELAGHGGKVWRAEYSPDGNLIASGSVDNTLRLWLVDDGVLLRTMFGHPFPITTLAFSPDGASLATGSSDGLVRIWRVSDGRLMRTLPGHAGWILDLKFSPDGNRLASSAQDFTVRLWRVADGKLMATVDEGMSTVHRLAFSPDSSQLAWVEESGLIRIWNVDAGGWVSVIRESGSASARSIAYAPDGETLAVGYNGGSIRLWNLSDGTEISQLIGHVGPVSDLAYSGDGEWLVSGSWDQTVRLWRIHFEEASDQPRMYKLSAHSGRVNSVSFSPAGDQVASASEDATIILWSVPED